MTVGQMLFFGGIGALLITIGVGIFFGVKKPKYIPSDATASVGSYATQQFRSGYPTRQIKKSKQRSTFETARTDDHAGTERMAGETAKIETASEAKTALLSQTAGQGSVGGTVPLGEKKTEKLESTAVQSQGTKQLEATEHTQALEPDEGRVDTTKLEEE